MLLVTKHDNFSAVVIGSGAKGWGINEVTGTEVTANGHSDTPANHIILRNAAISAGKNAHGFSH